jgi:2-oxoglutarate ferredoxin oxidoreductase subunit alpha
MTKELLTGNEVLTRGAIAAGAKLMTGYPITPTTEIMEHWAEAASQDKSLKMLQTEDEMSAGFALIGANLAGTKAFTASAGPGNVLMQDAFSMAEALRIPTVAFIMQRGGPSTGTVIYSQQEVNLTCLGGNGEGLRIVYSTSGLQDLYD